ncbi:hypothetical protein EVAR_11855_1 [Eumeta japonica]|uniref:Uncharacterized protein n=1 Tax=Eumeta variegata TaxID=151549 RepID=A0A4C1U8B8_EUMVA|nr:hypothetical protein EVAR_11855_1 [Eumeta japonica]
MSKPEADDGLDRVTRAVIYPPLRASNRRAAGRDRSRVGDSQRRNRHRHRERTATAAPAWRASDRSEDAPENTYTDYFVLNDLTVNLDRDPGRILPLESPTDKCKNMRNALQEGKKPYRLADARRVWRVTTVKYPLLVLVRPNDVICQGNSYRDRRSGNEGNVETDDFVK